jgi:hypothetical protein
VTQKLVLAFALLAALLAGREAPTQTPKQVVPGGSSPPGKVTPKLEAVAETRLLMEGLAVPNFRGADRLLRSKPANLEDWTFIRGQSLLIAELANLLMLRPPRGEGQPLWFERAAELREKGRPLARSAAAKDFEGSRINLVQIANSCNRCHQSFRVKVEIVPFAETPEKE